MSEELIPEDQLVEVVEDKPTLNRNNAEETLAEIAPEGGSKKVASSAGGGDGFVSYVAENLPDGLGIHQLLEPTALSFETPDVPEYQRLEEVTQNIIAEPEPTPDEPLTLVGTEVSFIYFFIQIYVFPFIQCGQWRTAEAVLDEVACFTPSVDDSLEGGSAADLIIGLVGDDYLIGYEGDDTLFGNQGCDTFVGGGGNDTLLGGASSDILIGSGGDDYLVGGHGSDIFTYISIEDGHDVIKDYSFGDIVDLDMLFDELIESGGTYERTYNLEVSPEDEGKHWWQKKDYILTVEGDGADDFSVLFQDLKYYEFEWLKGNIIIDEAGTPM
ncbi:MAG: hypothetical protein JJ879_12780 [Sneathiella sp.]|nr:hypothetical protein [Sneathiella sp.]